MTGAKHYERHIEKGKFRKHTVKAVAEDGSVRDECLWLNYKNEGALL
jgi:hypothetical protein